MGEGYEYTCPKCKSGNTLLEGYGYLHSPNRVFFCEDPLLKSLVSQTEFKKAELLLKDGWIPKKYGYTIFYCPKCRTIKNRFDFELSKGDEIYKPKFVCGKCKSKLKELSEAEEKKAKENDEHFFIKCKKCGNVFSRDENDEHYLIMWD